MHTTIVSVGLSSLEQGLIWVGTDDGNVQITRDGGGTWTNVRDNVRGLPEGIWIPDVQPSKHVPGRAYLVAEDHRRGDWTSHVHVTEDYGRSWESLATPEIDGFVHAIEEDPVSPDLLFLGTEFGLRVSFDRGKSWRKYTSGVPAVPIRDLVIHPRDADLVLATHGRAALILDDIRPLRALAMDPTIRDAPVYVFGPPPAYAVNIAEAIGYRSTGHAMQQGETRPFGALLTFWASEQDSARIEITDESGALAYSRAVSAEPGANRFDWNLRPGGDADEMAFPRQIAVLPGTYTVTVSIGDDSSRAALTVESDPRAPIGLGDLRARRAALQEMHRITQRVSDAREQLEETARGVEIVLETLASEASELRSQGEALATAIRELQERHFTGPECQGLCRGFPTIRVVQQPIGRISAEPSEPSANTRIMMDQAASAADVIIADVSALMNGDGARYREALLAAGYTPFGGWDR